MNHPQVLVIGLTVSLLSGCELWGAPLPDPDCKATAVDTQAELLTSEPWLRDDKRAKNRTGGAFSFAGQLAGLRARYPDFDAAELWRLVGTGVDASSPASQLPFRLLALVNRSDLAEQLAPESPAGEGRLVYTLTAGPGDETSAAALPLSVIFEYSLGSARGARDWAAEFHALGQIDDEKSQARADAANALVTSFISPAETNSAPRLSQIRVNDARSGAPELYELALDDSGTLKRRGLRNTPRLELANTPELAAFMHDNAGDISTGSHRVPADWLAVSAAMQSVDWLPAAPELQHAFARSTCPGCHGPDGPGNAGFHIAEAPDGSVTLSTFLRDEDLPRRAEVMRARLCQ